MTGVVPHWKRNVYCRLRWTKRSGTELEMLWCLEQGYYRDGGWRPTNIEVIANGLVRISISP